MIKLFTRLKVKIRRHVGVIDDKLLNLLKYTLSTFINNCTEYNLLVSFKIRLNNKVGYYSPFVIYNLNLNKLYGILLDPMLLKHVYDLKQVYFIILKVPKYIEIVPFNYFDTVLNQLPVTMDMFEWLDLSQNSNLVILNSQEQISNNWVEYKFYLKNIENNKTYLVIDLREINDDKNNFIRAIDNTLIQYSNGSILRCYKFKNLNTY